MIAAGLSAKDQVVPTSDNFDPFDPRTWIDSRSKAFPPGSMWRATVELEVDAAALPALDDGPGRLIKIERIDICWNCGGSLKDSSVHEAREAPGVGPSGSKSWAGRLCDSCYAKRVEQAEK
jgi:hypothetical protein